MTALARTPLLVFMLGSLTAFAPMSIDMYLPALPELQKSLLTDPAHLQLTLASFFAAFAIGQLFYGPLADRFGRKPPLYFGIALFSLTSLACMWVTTVETLIALRFIQALGACAGVVIARAVVRDSFDGVEASRMYAAMMLVMGVAPMVAPMLGGQLLLWFGWHSIFGMLALYGGLVLFLMHKKLPETLAIADRQPLRLGFSLRAYGSLLMAHQFRGFALTSSLSMSGLYAFIAASPFVFMVYFGLDVQQYGLLFGANAFCLIMATQINSRVLDRWSPLTVLKRSLLLQMLAGSCFGVLAYTGWGGFWALIAPLALYTGCLGFVLPNATILALGPYKHQAGTASALYGTIGSVSGAIAASLVSVLQSDNAMVLGAVIAVCGISACLRSRFLPQRIQQTSAVA
jgi:DHA1 family bicyclomycin/chloramphenicol resistance-like MFS transporter